MMDGLQMFYLVLLLVIVGVTGYYWGKDSS